MIRNPILTEDQIERKVERAMNGLDSQLLRGDLTQAEYDAEVVNLDDWAKAEYDRRKDHENH